jgi:hypothetical protein
MTGSASQIEATLLDHHLPLLEGQLPLGEFVMPHFDGYSIANVPATTANLLGVRLPASKPIPEPVWKEYVGGVRCVVCVTIDALGYHRLQRFMDAETDTVFQRLAGRGGRLVPLTSVCPSTTTTALSSLWTGRTPVEHGMLGTRLFLRDQGVRANMIFFTPTAFQRPNVLLDEGMEPAQFLPVPGLAETLARHGIESHVFINQQYSKGGLAHIFFRGVTEVHEVVPGSAADLWSLLRRFLEDRRGDKLFVSVYWGLLDAIAHLRGPSSRVIDAELRTWSTLMVREFLERLRPEAAQGTVMVILSDHGQRDTPPAKAIRLDQHPKLAERLLMKPLGEQRLPYLFVLQGQSQVVRRYVQEHLKHAFAILDSRRALEAGLFGPGKPTQETAARLGDLLLVSRQDHFLYDRDGEPRNLGLHGGLSAEEMLVPLLLARLDA